MNELLANAGCGLTPIRLSDEREPMRADLTTFESHLEEIEQREELANALKHVVVSDAIRRECEEEMRRGEQRGWKN